MTNLMFAELEKAFRNNDFPLIENDAKGIRFLKLRSMSRKAPMEEFCKLHHIDLDGYKSKDYLGLVFKNNISTDRYLHTWPGWVHKK